MPKFCFYKCLDNVMICENCSDKLEKMITNLPYKVNYDSIVIIKGIPVLQCRNCREYVIEDEVMQNVDSILNRIDKTAELDKIVNSRY